MKGGSEIRSNRSKDVPLGRCERRIDLNRDSAEVNGRQRDQSAEERDVVGNVSLASLTYQNVKLAEVQWRHGLYDGVEVSGDL